MRHHDSKTILASLSCLLLLSACGGAGTDVPGAAGCVGSLSGGGTTVASGGTCTSFCGVSNDQNAIDGQRGTYASINFRTGGGGSLSLRATAQPGIVFPAGNNAGALMNLSGGGAANTVSINTYKGGAPQESQQITVNGVGGANQDDQVYSFKTTMDFDAVEVLTTNQSTTGDFSVRVYEFCSHT